jgi:hypothetical protein
MNERIKALANESRLLTGWPVGEVEYQKFAELIINECASLAEDGFFDDLDGQEICDGIKNHFGV